MQKWSVTQRNQIPVPLLYALIMMASSVSWAESTDIKLEFVSKDNERHVPEIQWDPEPLSLKEIKSNDNTSSNYVALVGEVLNNFQKSIVLIPEKSDSIPVKPDSTDGHRFSVDVPIHEKITRFQIVSVNSEGAPSKDDYFLEVPLYKPPASITDPNLRFHLLRGSLASALFYYNATSYTITPMLAWKPAFKWTHFLVQLDLEVAPLARGSFYYLCFEYGLGASYNIYKGFWLGVTGGMQYFSDYSTSSPIVGGTLTWQFNHKIFFFVDQVFAEYDAFFGTSFYANEGKLGAGISF